MVLAPENRQISDVRNRGGAVKALPGSVVIVLFVWLWNLVVRDAGFCLETGVTPSRASRIVAPLAPTGECIPNVGAKLAREAFSA
jgi:hypothetical protein